MLGLDGKNFLRGNACKNHSGTFSPYPWSPPASPEKKRYCKPVGGCPAVLIRPASLAQKALVGAVLCRTIGR